MKRGDTLRHLEDALAVALAALMRRRDVESIAFFDHGRIHWTSVSSGKMRVQ